MKFLDSARKTCLDDTYSAQLIARIITCQFEDDLSSVRKWKSRTQRYSASGWSWMNLWLCKAFEQEKISSVFSKRELCWKFESRHSPDLREEECCLYPQHEHISRVSFLVCLSVFACTPIHSNSPTISTDSLACIAGALTKQLSDLPLSKTCVAHVSDIVIEYTRIPQLPTATPRPCGRESSCNA